MMDSESRGRLTTSVCDLRIAVCSPVRPGSVTDSGTDSWTTGSIGGGLTYRGTLNLTGSKIGRASCRERAEISVVGVSLKKKTNGSHRNKLKQKIVPEPSGDSLSPPCTT